MAGQLLIEYLERRKACFKRQVHRKVFTAIEAAQSRDICDHAFAKVVMIKIDGELAMVVLPAPHHLKLSVLRDLLGAGEIRLATEKEFAFRFPRCELGAMPPFGHLYGLQTYFVPMFEQGKDIAFNAGSHSELIRMPIDEYVRLASVTPILQGGIPRTLRSSPLYSQMLEMTVVDG
ncbi:MAG: YbaK/EbsC family protein [Spongiibacteraceae bacterium]|nr:YbaK/EbsC family protein [Spongiibacteraceae bacterium]